MAQKQKVKVVAKTVKTAGKIVPAKKSTAVRSSGAKTLGAKAAATPKKTAPVKAKEASVKKTVKAEVLKKSAAPLKAVKKPALKSASTKIQAAAAKIAAAKPQVKTLAASPVAAVVAARAAAAKTSANRASANKAPAAKPNVMTKPAAAPVQRAVPAAITKPADQRITAPVPATPVAAAAPASPKALAEKAAAARGVMGAMAANKKPVSARHGFKTNEFVVYPAHGVGRIVGIEEQEIAGMSLELFVITFEKEKLTLRVPTGKLASIGMRKLAEEPVVKRAMETLKGRARVKRTMWSRRAQEYVAKINSGDLISIAEVVRDLYRSEAQPEQSYSERQLYENALERMARELAAVERLDERGAVQRIVEILSKSAKGRRLAAEVADAAESDIKAA